MEYFVLNFQVFCVLFARLLAMFGVAPFFGGQALSYFYRVGLAFIISLIVVPVVALPNEFYDLLKSRFFNLIIEQLLIGIFIGLSLQFLFAAFQMAGEFFSVQMGFGISEVFDPLSQTSLPLLGTVKNLIGLFVFFVGGSHLLIIEAVVFSYEKIPFLSMNFLLEGFKHEGLLKFFVLLSSGMFLIALKISLPVMGTLLLVSITVGILSKAAPQMNILMLGFPIKIIVAFIVLAWLSPIIIETMSGQLDAFFSHLDTIIKKWN
ncbi:MAG: flagellar biosynthetic protein FliR [Spirochaetia bacterium]|nr:flagellar biosynthetic protein FliR [Spirochaetia bacterium]